MSSRRVAVVLRCPECGSASLASPGEGCGWCRAAEQLAETDAQLTALGASMGTMMSAMAEAVTRQGELIMGALGPAFAALMEGRGVRALEGDPTGDGPLPHFPMAGPGDDPPSAACRNCGRDVLAHVGRTWRRECPGWDPLPRS